MRYYQRDKYPIEFVFSENIDKHFDSHNHVGHLEMWYSVISQKREMLQIISRWEV